MTGTVSSQMTLRPRRKGSASLCLARPPHTPTDPLLISTSSGHLCANSTATSHVQRQHSGSPRSVPLLSRTVHSCSAPTPRQQVQIQIAPTLALLNCLFRALIALSFHTLQPRRFFLLCLLAFSVASCCRSGLPTSTPSAPRSPWTALRLSSRFSIFFAACKR